MLCRSLRQLPLSELIFEGHLLSSGAATVERKKFSDTYPSPTYFVPFMFVLLNLLQIGQTCVGFLMIDQQTLQFLSEASAEGEAEWLADNRIRLKLARQNLSEFASALFLGAVRLDPRIAEANRDARKCLATAQISKGVAPITIRVSLSRNSAATYFMSISQAYSYVGGGALSPQPRLARILRQTISSQTGKWRGIVEGALFRTYFPNGLSDGRHASGKPYMKDHDALDFFNLKNFGACRDVSPQMLMSPDLLEEAVKSFAAARGLVDYINRATTKLPELA